MTVNRIHNIIIKKYGEKEKKNLFALEEFDSSSIIISFPHLRHTANSRCSKYSNSNGSTEHHRRLNGIRPNDRFQATLKFKKNYIFFHN